MHTAKSLKKIISYFHITKIQKQYVLACIFCFNNQFIKNYENYTNISKIWKNILLSFSIWDYKFTCKIYSWY
jgi:hypothetical protein